MLTHGLAWHSSDLTDLLRATAREIILETGLQQEASEITDSLFLEYGPQSTDLINTSVFEPSPLNQQRLPKAGVLPGTAAVDLERMNWKACKKSWKSRSFPGRKCLCNALL